MKKLRIIAIVMSFFCLWLSSFVSTTIEISLGFLLILSFGILHGSNDIFLIEKLNDTNQNSSYGRLLIFYIGFVAAAVGLFYVLPLVALFIFVVCSGYHFGEQHWEDQLILLPPFGKKIFYTVYGFFILGLLFYLQQEAVITVINAISGVRLPTTLLTLLFYISGSALIILAGLLSIKDVGFRRQGIIELFYLLIFAIIFKVSSLIWGFAIYFIFWHSLPSLYDQIQFLYEDVDSTSVKLYVKKAFPFWGISVIAIVALYYIFRNLEIFYALFFSFLAAVTFPHSLAITTMFKKKKKDVGDKTG